jgi:hypothetical protein
MIFCSINNNNRGKRSSCWSITNEKWKTRSVTCNPLEGEAHSWIPDTNLILDFFFHLWILVVRLLLLLKCFCVSPKLLDFQQGHSLCDRRSWWRVEDPQQRRLVYWISNFFLPGPFLLLFFNDRDRRKRLYPTSFLRKKKKKMLIVSWREILRACIAPSRNLNWHVKIEALHLS